MPILQKETASNFDIKVGGGTCGCGRSGNVQKQDHVKLSAVQNFTPLSYAVWHLNNSLNVAEAFLDNPEGVADCETRQNAQDGFNMFGIGEAGIVWPAGDECELKMHRLADPDIYIDGIADPEVRAAALDAIRGVQPERIAGWAELKEAFHDVKLRVIDPIIDTFHPNGSDDIYVGGARVLFEIKRQLIDGSYGMVSKTLPARVWVRVDDENHAEVEKFVMNLDSF